MSTPPVASMHMPQAVLLENVRFHAGETSNDAAFAGRLAELVDAYVGDAFGVTHRDQASVTVGNTHTHVCMCVCARACVSACVRACVGVRTCAHVRA
jgi:3-phosphoglycerate kinase